MKEKSNKCFITGILPRLNANTYHLSRAIGINNRLEKMCKEANVAFIDTWDAFAMNRNYFRKEKVHLNTRGTEKLSDLYTTLISYHLKDGNFQKS